MNTSNRDNSSGLLVMDVRRGQRFKPGQSVIPKAAKAEKM
jgi:hypothetical protein